MKRYGLLLGMILFLFGWSQAQIQAFVNSEQISTDDQLVLTIEIEGGGRVSTPRFPQIQGFQAGGVSTRTNIVNWKQTISFSQTYFPTQTGTFSTPSFNYKYNGKVFNVPEFTIKVTKGTGRRKQQSQRRNPFDDFFNDPFFSDPYGRRGNGQQKQQKDLVFQETNADFFLSINLNKDECFIGEQVLGEVVLYINERDQGKVHVDAMAIGEMQQRIKNNDFWEEIIEFKEIPMERVTLNGKRYLTYTLYRTVLFPIKTGEIKFENVWLGAKKLHVATNVSPFDQFFLNTQKFEPIRIFAPNEKLSVSPLPETDLPNSNSVGKFKLQAKLDTRKAKTGEPVTLTINIKGNGNASLIQEPVVPFSKSFEVYDPNSTVETHKSANGLYGEKEIEYTFVPTEAGEYNLGPVKFYYFNPTEEVFDSLQVPNLPLDVSGENLTAMMLKSSSLDGFYMKGIEQASDRKPFRMPFKKGIFFIGLGLLIGAGGFRFYKSQQKDK